MKPRLRWGVDFHTYDGIYQGSRSHVLGLYREAIIQAPDIDFLFFLSNPEQLRRAHPEFGLANVHLVTMPHRSGILRLAWQLPSLQRRHHVNLLHVQYRLPLVPAGSCICTMHDVLYETHPQYFSKGFVRMARWSARRAAAGALLILTVSDYSRREILSRYSMNPERVVITPNAVDVQRFNPGGGGVEQLQRWGLKSGDYLCMLGRLEPRKNHRSAVLAYSRLGPGTPKLLIVGQRDFAYDDVFALVRSLKLADRVQILESVDDEALPVVLRHAKLVIYPSFAEGFGMPVLEAMASGVPVVASNTTSIPEVAGTAAWLIDPHDLSAMTDAFQLALSETPTARSERIARGLRQAAQYTWHASAAALLHAVRTVQSARFSC